MRCDFNVSLNEKGEIENDMRIKEALPTISYLIRSGAKVVLLSHFKEPKEKRSMRERGGEVREGSISPVKERLSFLLKKEVDLAPDCIGEVVKKRVSAMKEGNVLLLENVRIYKEEKNNSEEFGRSLASFSDIFVNDAFSVSHREHASVVHPPSFLPSVKGMLMEKEIKVLDRVKRNPKRPLVAIVGGAKVESKIGAVDFFLREADHILVGGKIANALLLARGIALNLPQPEDGLMDTVRELDYTSPKLHLPVDVVTAPDGTGEGEIKETAPGKIEEERDVFDIGEETIELYRKVIREAGTVIWAGPLGLSEKKPFESGTKEIGREIVENEEALKVVGGGDTSGALMRLGFLEGMDLVSCGGGAMLTFLRNGEMPGIEALRKAKN